MARRFASRQPDSFAAKIVAALRNQFGGHKFFEESAGAEASRLSSDDPVMMYNLACLYSLLDEPEMALDWLEKARRLGEKVQVKGR